MTNTIVEKQTDTDGRRPRSAPYRCPSNPAPVSDDSKFLRQSLAVMDVEIPADRSGRDHSKNSPQAPNPEAVCRDCCPRRGCRSGWLRRVRLNLDIQIDAFENHAPRLHHRGPLDCAEIDRGSVLDPLGGPDRPFDDVRHIGPIAAPAPRRPRRQRDFVAGNARADHGDDCVVGGTALSVRAEI